MKKRIKQKEKKGKTSIKTMKDRNIKDNMWG